MKQSGGIYIDGSPMKAFRHFLSDCTIELLSTGRSGAVFVLTYQGDPATSPYKSSSVFNWREPITKIVMKIAAVKEGDFGSWTDSYRKSRTVESVDDFTKEILYQTDIFLKSAMEQRQLTPAPVYAAIFDGTPGSMVMLNAFSHFARSDRRALDELSEFKNAMTANQFSKLGLIAMELAGRNEDFHVLFDLRNRPEYQLYKDMAKVQLINMVKTGYMHDDFHMNNVLIKMRNGVPVDVYIIDFGRSERVHESFRQKIIDHFDRQEYPDTLQAFRNFTDDTGMMLGDWLKRYSYYGYEWIWEKSSNLPPAISKFDEFYAEKRAAMTAKNISDDMYRGDFLELYEPSREVKTVALSHPHMGLAIESISGIKRDSHAFRERMMAVSRAAEELAHNAAEVAAILSDMTEHVSKRVDAELSAAILSVKTAEEKLESSKASLSAGTISEKDTFRFARSIMNGVKITLQNATRILGPPTGPVSRIRSLPTRNKSKSASRRRATRRKWSL